ncbi:TPA: 4Fe-4S ferredoxin [bacterium UBP9_UBA11836]|nr:4Fe-4S ferredoxin [bacterium UBP9_UBA11836]
MPHVITDSCITCGSCAENCPVEAIHTADGESQYFINPEVCIDCGACKSCCGADAIYADDELPADKEQFIQINAEFYK